MREFAGDTWALLVEWGIWSREGRPSLLGNSPLLQLMAKPSSAPMPKITDDLALRVDRIASDLKRRDSRLYLSLELVFIRGWSVREVAENMGVSRIVADKLVSGAVAWVDSALSYFSSAA